MNKTNSKLYLIGIISFLSSILFYNFCGIALGAFSFVPQSNSVGYSILIGITIVSLLLFFLLIKSKYTFNNLVFLLLLPIGLLLMNLFLGKLNEFDSGNYSRHLWFFGQSVIFEKVLILFEVLLLLSFSLNKNNGNTD